jgi:hypothetical protein
VQNKPCEGYYRYCSMCGVSCYPVPVPIPIQYKRRKHHSRASSLLAWQAQKCLTASRWVNKENAREATRNHSLDPQQTNKPTNKRGNALVCETEGFGAYKHRHAASARSRLQPAVWMTEGNENSYFAAYNTGNIVCELRSSPADPHGALPARDCKFRATRDKEEKIQIHLIQSHG